MGNTSIPVVLILSVEIILNVFSIRVGAQEVEHGSGIEISAGGCGVLYQSSFTTENFLGIELAARGNWGNVTSWQAGTRIWFDPVLPELFGRQVCGLYHSILMDQKDMHLFLNLDMELEPTMANILNLHSCPLA